MLRKLIFLTIIAIFLTGCGASAPAEDAQIAETAPALAMGTDTPPASAGYDAPETLETTAEAKSANIPEYFVFTKRTNTVTNEDGLTLFIENQTIPTFTSADADRSAWVGELLTEIDRYYTSDSSNLLEYAKEFVESNGTDYFYSYSNYQQLGVARHDETVVSLLSLSSLYSGGSHPNSVQIAYNLDIENRRTLRLEDIITESGAEELAELVRAGVDEKFAPIDGGNGLFDDYASTIDNSMTWGSMTPYWYLNDTGLVIFYNQYELGPYAAGIITVELPYDSLDGILLEEYLPAEPDGIPGDLVLRGEWEGYRRIPITIEADGETLLVGVEGQVHQVRLSEVLWLDETPIAQEILFSAKSLGQNDVLEITGGYTSDERSFCIEFTNGLGEEKIYYLHLDGLSEEP